MNKNKNHKKIIAVAAIASLVVPVAAYANTNFKDVKNNAFYTEAVNDLAERGIINGFKEDNTFRPNDNVTRAQAAKIIAGVMGLDTKVVQNPKFTDVPTTNFYYGAIAALANAGIINGIQGTQTFEPNKPMTRYQMAKVIALAFKLDAKSTSLPYTDVVDFYKDYVQTLFDNEITTGTTASTYSGNQYVKRSELATFVYRAEAINKEVSAPVKVGQTELNGTISAITSNTITIQDKIYTIPSEFKQILNETNAAALDGALVKGTLKNDDIELITSISIKKESTKENPVKIQTVIPPVASLTAIEPGTWTPELIIETPFVELVNFTGNTLRLNSSVKDVRLTNAQILKLIIEERVAATIRGNAVIQDAQILTTGPVDFDVKGTVSTLNVLASAGKIKIGTLLKIDNILALSDITGIISNLAAIKPNIKKVNGEVLAVTPQPTTPSTDGNTGVVSSYTQSGNITETNATSVKVDGKTYQVASNLSNLFSNATLQGAAIKVTIQSNVVTQVNDLTIVQAGTVNANGVTVNGNVSIAADNVSVNGLTVTGNVYLKQQVQTAVDFNNTTIKGTLITEETIATKFNARVASLAPIMLVEATTTRLIITFANSVVAYVEIKKVDTVLSMEGATQISIISLEANGSIIAGPEVVLPNLKVSKGVTEIELNASIASVEIETNSDISITGKGNFDSVKVNTDKAVELKTEGTIKALAASGSNITLGGQIKVGATQDLNGNSKSAEELIQNFEQVKDNVNVKIEENVTQPIAAKLMPVEGKYGYVTISVVNGQGKKIKYRQVPIRNEGDLAAIGTTVPQDTKNYNVGDEFIGWLTQDVQVYVVDDQDKVLDAYEIDNSSTNAIRTNSYTIENGKLTYKTTFAKDLKVRAIYFAEEANFFMQEAVELGSWYLDETGIPTIEITVPKWFTTDNSMYARFVLCFEGQEEGTYLSGEHFGSYDDRNKTEVYALNRILSVYSMDNQNARMFVSHILDSIASEGIEVKDPSGNIMHTTYESIAKYRFFDFYVANIKENGYTTAEDIKAAVIEINEKYAEYEAKLNEVEAALNALYVDKSNKNQYARLKAGITDAEISSMEELIKALPEGSEKKNYLSNIDSVKRTYSDMQSLSQLLTWANAYPNASDEEKNTLRNNIWRVIYNFSFVINEDAYKYLADLGKFNAYLEQLLLLNPEITPTQQEILKIVSEINSKQEALQNENMNESKVKSTELKLTEDGYEIVITFNEAIQLDGNVQLVFGGSLAGTNYQQPTISENNQLVFKLTNLNTSLDAGTVSINGGIKTAKGETILEKDIISNLVK